MAGHILDLIRRQHEGAPGRHESVSCSRFIEQLLDLLETEVARDEAPISAELLAEIAQARSATGDACDGDAVARAGTAGIGLCGRYFGLRRAWETEREEGLHGIINLLRETLSKVAADSGSFTESLTTVYDRVGALVELGDIQVLKQRLTQEVNEIRDELRKKQQRDKKAQESLARRVEALETRLTETQVAAAIDPLTQVAHRGQFDRSLQRWLQRPPGLPDSFVVVMIDVDHFKGVNDTHGHPAGDRALLAVAQMLTTAVRPCDLVARYGGDEFAALLAGITLKQAEKRMSEFIAKIAATEISYDGAGKTQSLRLTVSCGLTESDSHDSAERLLQRADEALYAAKQHGRNRAVAKQPSPWRDKLPQRMTHRVR